MDTKIVNVSEFLRSNGIKPSFQRMKIFEYLMNTTEHPTVDVIYKSLIHEIPTLSKTTVYNTLNLFVQNNVALLITIEDNETRYDANTSLHGHFKCEKCERVLDFKAEISDLVIKELDKFQINQQHIYFKGICSGCL
ncbi:MAG: transcriptional repressor [Acidaminobacteraceae bacterium]